MAPQANLVKAGAEGFDMLDRVFGRPRTTDKHFPRKQAEIITSKKAAEIINSKKAAEIYGGVLLTDDSNGKANRSVTGLKN